MVTCVEALLWQLSVVLKAELVFPGLLCMLRQTTLNKTNSDRKRNQPLILS